MRQLLFAGVLGVRAALCRALVPVVILMLLLVSAAKAQSSSSGSAPGSATKSANSNAGPSPSVGDPNSSYHPMEIMESTSHHFFDTEGQIIVASGIAATFAGHWLLDDDIRSEFNGQHRLGGVDNFTNDFVGTGIPEVIAGIGFWIYGATAGKNYELNAGQAQLEALAATGVATLALKSSIQRERPNGSDNLSFPSGHTSTVFASATALQEFYGWKVGLPLYALGLVTAEGRWDADMHWFSDTVAGAALGIWISRAFAKGHFDIMPDPGLAKNRSKWFVWPEVVEDQVMLRAFFEI